MAVELVTTSISSAGLAAEVGIDPTTLDPAILGLAYGELLHRGYTRCTVNPSTWTAEFVGVDDVLDPASATVVLAAGVIEAGTPAITF